MCLRPINIKNPNYHRTGYASQCGDIFRVPANLSPSTEYISVPCGKCAECRDSYFSSILQRALVESYTSYMYFVTLTYDNDHIPSLVLPTGDVVYYSDYSDVQLMFKRFRDSNCFDRDFRYLCVNEYGDNRHRPHLHLLIFVAKCDKDTRNTPHIIERTLFDNLGKFFALNVGTRKHPIYEPLFTFKARMINGRLHSNYFVKYVEDTINFDYLHSSADDSTYIKTIRYLIGYINKGSYFDTHIIQLLDNIPDYDPIKSKLLNLLRCRLRFSKGFGCGFINGKKHYLPRVSIRGSLNSFVYSDVVRSLPDYFGDFTGIYPDLYNSFKSFIACDRYSNFDNLQECLRSFTYDDYLMHCITLKYFPNYISNRIERYYKKDRVVPTISFFFNHLKYKYQYPVAETKQIEYSATFDKLRSMVTDGIKDKCPYISFRLDTEQRYIPMCKYYRDRVVFLDDYQAMFDALNVRNWEEWQNLFEKQYNTKKASKSSGNVLKYEKNAENICIIQKSCLGLRRVLKGIDLFRELLTD